MKTISHLAAIVAMMFLSSLCMADDYGWSGSASRSHVGSGYGRSADYYGSGYGPSTISHLANYGRSYRNQTGGYGYSINGYRGVSVRGAVVPISSRYSNYPAYGSRYDSGIGSGYSGNTGYCPYDSIGSGYYGR